MGDAGSAGLGFILAFLTIEFIESRPIVISPTLALWLFLVPIFDAVFVIFNRLLEGKSIFEPSVRHTHHILSISIGSKNRVLITMVILCITFTAVGIALNQSNDFVSLTFFMLVMFLMRFVLYFLE